MSEPNNQQEPVSGEIIFYEGTDGRKRAEVQYHQEMFWMSLDQLADIFGVDKSGISRHLKNIFESGELQKDSVVAKFATTAADGKTYQVSFYNLDAAISVGYRVNSTEATRFRIWATQGYFPCNHRVSDYTGLNNTRQGSALMCILKSAGYLFLGRDL